MRQISVIYGDIEKISSSFLPQEYPDFPFLQVPLAELEKDEILQVALAENTQTPIWQVSLAKLEKDKPKM